MSNHSCPNCEYERGTTGKPVSKGNLIECLECGTSWKEFSGSGLLIDEGKKASKTVKVSELRKMARGEHEFFTDEEFDHQQSFTSTPKASSGFAQASLCGLLLVGGIGLAGWFMTNTTFTSPAPSNTVEVVDLKLKEQISHDGRKIITVRGKIENQTQEKKLAPRVAIILKRTDGGEIIRWRYSPPNIILEPGGNTRFSSSIQYDTPVIAYAEAVIE